MRMNENLKSEQNKVTSKPKQANTGNGKSAKAKNKNKKKIQMTL